MQVLQAPPHVHNHAHSLQIRRILKTLLDPLVQGSRISRHKLRLERLRLQHHTRRHRVTLEEIQLRPIPQIVRFPHMKRQYQPREDHI